jgi:hypothetical protein
MGKPGINIIYEDVKRAAEANGKSVRETLEIIGKTVEVDRADHPDEYASPARRPLLPGGVPCS